MLSVVRALGLLFMLALASLPAQAAGPLVEVDWLKANLGKPDVVLLDVRSGAGITRDGYLKGHVPGAVFTDYAKDGWREKNAAGIESMLPPPDKLEKLIGSFGIAPGVQAVLIPEGRTAADMATATRIYWTLKMMGHDTVSILNGGFMAWIKEVDKAGKPVNPLATDDVKPSPKAFKAAVRQEMLISRDDVKAAVDAKQPLVDNRPYDFFMGLVKSPVAKAAGTLPGARSLPEGWMMENGGGIFRSKAQLEKLYSQAGVPVSGAQINFCNTGHWASLGWFVGHELLGNRSAKMYHGSMADWTHDASLPVERKVNLQ